MFQKSAEGEPSKPSKGPSEGFEDSPDEHFADSQPATREQSPRVAERVSEIHSFQLPESEAPIAQNEGPDWTWDGENWTVYDRVGSARTRQFYLRIKTTTGKWRYASATSLSFAEYNRRFTSKKFVVDKVHKVTRKKDHEKFKEFCFEAWRAQAIRTNFTAYRSASGDS
jgi:hypothetical protein